MLKQADTHRRTGIAIPMIVHLALGLLFFGVYVAASQFSAALLSARATLTFLGAYVAFGLLACLFFLLKERKQRGEEIMFETLNTKMHNMF